MAVKKKKYSTGFEEIEKQINKKQLKESQRREIREELIKRLQECKAGDKKNPDTEESYWKEYEKLCEDILKKIFKNEFRHPLSIDTQSSPRKVTGYYRTICDISVTNNAPQDTFWEEIKKEYNCKEIVFECKNLKGKVKAQHVFQLFLYLKKKTGRFGVIFSRKGLSESGILAINKLYKINSGLEKNKEHYLILVLDDEDLKNMLSLYQDGIKQSNFFRQKLTEHYRKIILPA